MKNICRSCYFHLRNIGSIRNLLTPMATETLVHALVTSRLDTGNAMLFGVTDSLCQKLQHVQNTAARILTRTKKYQHITPVLQKLHWLPMRKSINFKTLLLVFKALRDLAPGYIHDIVTPYAPTRVLRSKDSEKLIVPKARLKTVGDRAFASAAPSLWNALPNELRVNSRSLSLECLKKMIKGSSLLLYMTEIKLNERL